MTRIVSSFPQISVFFIAPPRKKGHRARPSGNLLHRSYVNPVGFCSCSHVVSSVLQATSACFLRLQGISVNYTWLPRRKSELSMLFSSRNHVPDLARLSPAENWAILISGVCYSKWWTAKLQSYYTHLYFRQAAAKENNKSQKKQSNKKSAVIEQRT